MALVTVIACPQSIIMSHLAALMDGESVSLLVLLFKLGCLRGAAVQYNIAHMQYVGRSVLINEATNHEE